MLHNNHGRSRSNFHQVKRLNHFNRNDNHQIKNLPANLLKDHLFERTMNYVKYFDYPLAQLLTDHSTDPLQNTSRQYIDTDTTISSEGRFVNHEMDIRRNGETTILRPKQDPVLANGFTPVIRPSSKLPSYQSIMSHSQVSSASSLSIMNKMSERKQPEQTAIIKTKRKNRHRPKRCNEKVFEPHNYNVFNDQCQQTPQNSNVVNFFKQTLYDLIEEPDYFPPPPPLMSIRPEFHSPPPNPFYQPHFADQHFNPNYYKFHSPPPSSHSSVNNRYDESSYDLPFDHYHQPHSNHILPFDSFCANSYQSPPHTYTHLFN
ncbi:unnamed protein product [Adineta ricciae]|uniref:Uncharacterized protein n=1 Tax=Adineta ricciae TaxID=249248 RepID=A0A815ZLI6_ADIRI|nr:unnamed protein product [Adineta ricciae]